jgi:hypothetical protein
VLVGTDTLEVLSLAEYTEVDLTTETASTLTVCYSARGLALSACSTSGLPKWVGFTRGADTRKTRIQPLGQLEEL